MKKEEWIVLGQASTYTAAIALAMAYFGETPELWLLPAPFMLLALLCVYKCTN